jgi:ATP-dependent RNA helicase DeaD
VYAERSAPAHADRAAPARPPRPPDSRAHEPRAASGKPPRAGAPSLGNVWFRVNVGRSKNADPRWLLPLLCRRGGVVKNDIGKIEILSDHSKFEVSSRAARRFQEAAAKPDKKDPAISITPIR